MITELAGDSYVYLDHAATTPMRPEAIDAMSSVLREDFGNPSGVHRLARRARALLEDARDRFAAVVGADPHEVVFTGGGTEAINLAIVGSGRSSLWWSAVEHEAVRSSAGARDRAGGFVREIPVDDQGRVDLATVLESSPSPELAGSLVAVMAVNNEVGTIQPVGKLAEYLHAYDSLLLVDAVQALTWVDVRPIVDAADYVAFSGHKFGGPKGVGALVVRRGSPLAPLLHGGGQEQDRRSGTQNVAGIVAMAVAAESADRSREETNRVTSARRDRLVNELVSRIDGCTETTMRSTKVAGNAHVCIDGVVSEELLVVLDRLGVGASAGSACASGALHLSPVLLAMGMDKDRAAGALRLTLGPTTTDREIDMAVEAIPRAVVQLRGA